MPIYEYRCQKCGLEFELIQKSGDEPPSACRECGGPVSKLISRSGFQLKGSGWYVTDYARKGGEGGAKSEGGGKDKKDKPAKTESTKAETASPAATSSSESSKASTSGS